MSTISASTTSTTAYKVTADTTGTLVLQTGSTPTTAVTIGTNQVVTFAQAPSLPAASIPQAALAANVAGNGPAFLAYSSNGPSVSQSSWTAITFNNKEFDTATAYSTSTGRFTPQVAGYYQVNLVLRFAQASTYTGVAIYKNGTSFNGGYGTLLQVSISANIGLSQSVLVYMNGTTDYLVAYGYTSVTSQTIAVDPTASQFSAFLARAA